MKGNNKICYLNDTANKFIGDSTTNIMFNANIDVYTSNSGTQPYLGNYIFASGKTDSKDGSNKMKGNNYFVAKDATFDTEDSDIHIKGDLSLTGGLISPSAITLDGTNDKLYINHDADFNLFNAQAGTIEFWFKSASGSNQQAARIIDKNTGKYELDFTFLGLE